MAVGEAATHSFGMKIFDPDGHGCAPPVVTRGMSRRPAGIPAVPLMRHLGEVNILIKP